MHKNISKENPEKFTFGFFPLSIVETAGLVRLESEFSLLTLDQLEFVPPHCHWDLGI